MVSNGAAVALRAAGGLMLIVSVILPDNPIPPQPKTRLASYMQPLTEGQIRHKRP
jgi:hypothetical protein